MFNNLNLSNALALIDKPVWVITEVRGRMSWSKRVTIPIRFLIRLTVIRQLKP